MARSIEQHGAHGALKVAQTSVSQKICCKNVNLSLGGMMKQICADAKFPPKTNHTLRATGTFRMFAANVPENIIQQRTGQRSLNSLRRYECTSLEQKRSVSSVLASSNLTDYTSEFCKAEKSCKPETKLSQSEKSKDPLDKLNLQHCQNCTINITFNS